MAGGGLKFFPLDCQLDDKFRLVEAEFGLKGFAAVIKLFQKIYGGEGYYCDWTEEVALLFGQDVGLSDGTVSEIIKAAVRRGIFSDELFKKYNVLTSGGIQKRYVIGNSRKQKVEMKKEYLLLEAGDLRKNVYISGKNVYKNQENADIFKQTRRDDTIPNETKQDETGGSSVGDVFTVFERCGFQITSHAVDELNALSEEFPISWVIEAIKRSADRGKKSLGYIKGILGKWQIAGTMDTPQKSDTADSGRLSKEEAAALREKAEREAEAVIEKEREQMSQDSGTRSNINYNFLKNV